MTTLAAGTRLTKLIRDANAAQEPVTITSDSGNAVLVPEEDWRAIQETLYLLSLPGMRQSVVKGLKTPVKSCLKSVNW